MSLHDRLRAIRGRTSVTPESAQKGSMRGPQSVPDEFAHAQTVAYADALGTHVGFTSVAPQIQARVVSCPIEGMRAQALAENRYFLGPEIPYRSIGFLDIESTGLGGSAGNTAFLVGIGRIETSASGTVILLIEQVLLEDFPGEPLFLAYLQQRLADLECIVSYNGLSFDCPLLRDRFALNGIRREFPCQLDLLYPVRALFRKRLSNCSLSTVEKELLGIHRDIDLPGAYAPERYFRYLRENNESLLHEVSAHHLQDILSLYQVWREVELLCRAQETQLRVWDAAALGRLLLYGRRPGTRGVPPPAPALQSEAAERAVALLAETVRDHDRGIGERREAGRELMRYFKQQQSWNEALSYAILLSEQLQDSRAMLEAAKILEHRHRAYHRALEFVEQILRDGRVRPALSDKRGELTRAALQHRSARLQRKITASES